MQPTHPWSSDGRGNHDEQGNTDRLPIIRRTPTSTLEQLSTEKTEISTIHMPEAAASGKTSNGQLCDQEEISEGEAAAAQSVDAHAKGGTGKAEVASSEKGHEFQKSAGEITRAERDARRFAEQLEYLSKGTLAAINTMEMPSLPQTPPGIPVSKVGADISLLDIPITEAETALLTRVEIAEPGEKGEQLQPRLPFTPRPQPVLTRGRAVVSALLLCILLVHALSLGASQFLGPQGWAYVFGGPASTGDANLLKDITKKLQKTPQPGTAATVKAQITPEQYIKLIVQNMTPEQKLGQMMLVQFTGATDSLDLSTMIKQYNVGAVLIFAANGNIVSRSQLKNLVQQMQSNSGPIPLAVSIDQEGGYVNRLLNLDGARPAAATIGATRDPAKARVAGIQDAQDLQSYGMNLNLAPVVDVDTTRNSELHLDLRTYGTTAGQVTQMTGAYIQGLQQSGKVLATLKHFPGLGSVTVDPHKGIPHLTRSRADLEKIDWAPYKALIQQGNVYSIMVTHEIVDAIDPSRPASLSPQVIQGVLRDEFGFRGVIMTDSLTMAGITDLYTPGQAAALSVEAGADMIMGASSPNAVGTMIQGIKQAMNSGAISQQRIDDSVTRILMMKYKMGLLSIPKA